MRLRDQKLPFAFVVSYTMVESQSMRQGCVCVCVSPYFLFLLKYAHENELI